MPACAARTGVSRPASSICGTRRPTAPSWRPTRRGSRRCWAAIACERNAACRCCGKPPRSATIMFERNPETAAVKIPARLAELADGLAIAVAVSLPWSTSATSILVVLWLLAVMPTLDVAGLRRTLLTPAGGLPVLLLLLAAVGMLWADVPWAERLDGLSAFLKLAVVPLLIVQFRRSDWGQWLLVGFLVSCGLLLALSWAFVLGGPLDPSFLWTEKQYGIPVKDYISQSGVFTICAFALLELASNSWKERQGSHALGYGLLALLF